MIATKTELRSNTQATKAPTRKESMLKNREHCQSGASLVTNLVAVAILATGASLGWYAMSQAERNKAAQDRYVNFDQNRNYFLQNIDCARTFSLARPITADTCANNIAIQSGSGLLVPTAPDEASGPGPGQRGIRLGAYNYRAACGMDGGQWRLGIQWRRFNNAETSALSYNKSDRDGGIVFSAGTQSAWRELFPGTSLCPKPSAEPGLVSRTCGTPGAFVTGVDVATRTVSCSGFDITCPTGEYIAGFVNEKPQCAPHPLRNFKCTVAAGSTSCR